MIIKTERRSGFDRRQSPDPFAGDERRGPERREMCWEVENCDLSIRYRCPAFILRRPCWELWAVEGIGPARACCYNDRECEPGRCIIAEKRYAGTPQAAAAPAQELTVHVGRRGVPLGYSSRAATTARTSTSPRARRAGCRSRRRSSFAR